MSCMPATPLTWPWIASCGRAIRRSVSAPEMMTATTIPLRMSKTSTDSRVTKEKHQLAAPVPGEPAELGQVDEPGRGVDDDRAKGGGREHRQDRPQEQQDEDD